VQFFLDGFTKGGVFMYPILLCALCAIGVSLDRAAFVFFRANIHGPNFMARVQRMLLDGEIEGALRLCNAEPAAALPKVVKAALLRHDRPESELRDAVEEATLEVGPLINRRLAFLPMIANVATLIGLLGTIHGLIMAFDAVGLSDAAGRGELLSSGIAVAMYATFFGLVVSIPALVAHGLIAAQANAILDEVDHYGLKIINLLMALRAGGEATAPSPSPVLPFPGR
jgi:biopolymer transport protein ExbB/TolQ